MATTFQRTKSPIDISQLMNDLNASVDIQSTCTDISTDGTLITINWNIDLTVSEESAMDNIIDNYVYIENDIDANLLPFSDLGNKLAIHSSTKPAITDKDFYLVWTGAGDDVSGSPVTIADGPMLQFSMEPGTATVSVEARFAPEFGDVYIHEGYAKWDNAGLGDYMNASVVTDATQLQTTINLDLEIVDNWVKFATGGAGTGTHGFAASPVLLKRTKSKDGDWNYDEINGLTPNILGTGLYKISDIEREVHKYINKIPTFGSSYGYTNLTSDETAYLPPGYFLRITVHNISNTTWNACVFMEVFREQTAVP